MRPTKDQNPLLHAPRACRGYRGAGYVIGDGAHRQQPRYQAPAGPIPDGCEICGQIPERGQVHYVPERDDPRWERPAARRICGGCAEGRRVQVDQLIEPIYAAHTRRSQ